MSTHGTRQCFVYWRCAHSDSHAALEALRQTQDALKRAHAGLVAGRFVRSETDSAQATLMETYAMSADVTPQGLSEALQEVCLRAAGSATAKWLQGERHVEVFDHHTG